MLVEGQRLTPRYQIKRQLKKGGMGAIYEAYDNILDTTVAIKESLHEEECLQAAFRREAQLLANLHHPSLPHCSDLFAIGKAQYLVMEFIEGDDAATIMSKRGGPLPSETVLDWAKQLIDVVNYVHSQEILHRDISPANFKVKNGRLYLLDFGLAYGQSGEMKTIANGAFNWNCHTPGYSPLEQLRGERTSPASDLYSLAATLCKLLTNVPPDNAEIRLQRSLRREKDSIEANLCGRNVDENIRRAIVKTLSLNMDERPQSARHLREMMFPEPAVCSQGKVTDRRTRRRLTGAIMALVMLSSTFFASRSRGQKESNEKATPSVVEESARATDEAERLQRDGKNEEAIKSVELALALNPVNIKARFIFLDLLWDTKAGTAESVAEIDEVQAQADLILSEPEYVALAGAYLAKGKLSEAIAAANEALAQNNDSIAALMIRGTARFIDHKHRIDQTAADEVLNDFDHVIRLAPNYAQAYANRGDVRLSLGNWEGALSDYEKASSLIRQASFYTRLGKVYLLTQDRLNARAYFRKALEENPDYYKAYIGLGDAEFQDGNWAWAERNYVAANRIRKTAYVFARLGDTYSHLHQSDFSERSYEQAKRLGARTLN